MDTVDIIVALLAANAIIPLVHFIYRYHRYSPWRRWPEGTALMYQKIAMALVFMIILAARLFGDWPGREPITFILFGILIILFWRHDYLLIQAQKHTTFDRFKAFWKRMKEPPRPGNEQ